MSKKDIREYTMNRELSWLNFNSRVLEEAEDETVPALERLKFLSIFTDNLDEFFMIRVGSLTDLAALKNTDTDSRSGMTPGEQLSAIYKETGRLYKDGEKVWRMTDHQLREYGICTLDFSELSREEKNFVKKYFHTEIAPVLSPQIVDVHHPFPHLAGKTVHIGAVLNRKGHSVFGVIPVPACLPAVLYLPGEDLRYIPMEKVISAYLGEVFECYKIKEQVEFCIIRNADINAGDEEFELEEDFRNQMKLALKKRKRLGAVRLNLSGHISKEFLEYLLTKLELKEHQVFVTKLPFCMDYAFELESRLTEGKKSELIYRNFEPQFPEMVDFKTGMIKQVLRQDILLSYPYESMDSFLRLLKEAAENPDVISVKITIYRLAGRSKLAEYLCRAAENGKDVTVIIELRARFDEQNNIEWSEQLEEAGCRVIYGFEDYKVHSKLCLITFRDKGKIRRITQIGTGNYNEKTARQYTDLSLITADKQIGEDAAEFFKNMAIGNLNGSYRKLLVSPFSLKSSIIQMINEEKEKGKDGRIVLKMNSITDTDMIEALKDASCAGVRIRMIVRGICCILPGVPQRTENIEIRSIVGRFLEHSRIYCFGKGESEKIYISSADFMTRNTERRVEVACPVTDEKCCGKIKGILDAYFADNVKSRIRNSSGRKDECLPVNDEDRTDSQQYLMECAENLYKEAAEQKNPADKKKLQDFMTKIFGRFSA